MKNLHLTSWVLLIAVLVTGCTPDDTSSPAPEEVFVKYYGTNNSETVVDVEPYGDGYILFGSTNQNGDEDFFLVRVDGFGNEIERKVIPGIALSTEIPSRMMIHNDGTRDVVTFVGTSTFALVDGNSKEVTRIFVANVDPENFAADATINVYPTVPDPSAIALDDDDLDSLAQLNAEGNDIVKAPNENQYIILGSTEDVLDKSVDIAATNTKDMYLIKIGQDLPDNLTFERRFGFDGEDLGIRLLNSNTELFLMGSTEQSAQGEGGVNILYIPLDLNGLGDARHTYGSGTNSNDLPTDMILSGNRLVVVGTSQGAQNDSFILSIPTSGGNPIFNEIINDATLSRSTSDVGNNSESFSGNSLTGVTQLLNGNFMVVGQVSTYIDETGINKNGEMLFATTNQFGVVDSTLVQTFGGIGNDLGNVVIQNADGSLAIGATTDFQGGATMMTLLKTNSRGQIIK